jgi:TPR repeat protein
MQRGKMTSKSRFDEGLLAYEKGHFREAFEIFETGAESGDIDCMTYLGVMYTCGEGVACSYDKAVEWLRKAVQAGSTSAMLNLGTTYRIKGELRQAKRWFEEALNLGDAEAAFELARLYLVSDLETETVRKYLKIVLTEKNVCESSKEKAESLLRELSD